MKKLLLTAFTAAITLFANAQTTNVTHENDSSSLEIDAFGGRNQYFDLTADGYSMTSSGYIVLWNGTDFYHGNDDYSDFTTDSIINQSIFFDSLSTDIQDSIIITAGADSLTPFNMETFDGAYEIKMHTYSEYNENYFLVVFDIINNTDSINNMKLAFTNDFDLDGGSSDSVSIYYPNLPMVVQHDGEDEAWSTAGVSIVQGTLDNYRLGFCCDITWEDQDIVEYFKGTLATDVNADINDDQEVTISADLGAIEAGDSARVAFMISGRAGNSSEDALNKMQNDHIKAMELYEYLNTDDTPQSVIAQNLFSEGLIVYPNPVNANSVIEIPQEIGAVKRSFISTMTGHTIVLDVNNINFEFLETGNYILTIEGENGVASKKISKL